MKFNTWVAQEVKQRTAEIDEYRKALVEKQAELKKEQKQKREIGRKDNKNSRLHEQSDARIALVKSKIESDKSKISFCKDEIAEYKNLSKTKPVRLKTGAVVNFKIIDEMLKKLTGKSWSIEYTQYQDGLQIAYINTQSGAKGSLEAYDLGGLPDEVELPLFEKGEVKECSIRS